MQYFLTNDAANRLLKILGIIVAAMSLVSFIQRFLSIGFGPMASLYLGYYRQIAHFVFGVPFEIIGINVPAKIIDLWAISFVCSGAYVKSENIEYSRAFDRFRLKSPCLKLRVAIFLLAGFTGLGLVVPMSALSIHTYTENDIMKESVKNMLYVVGATFLFFMLNAFAPSA